MFKYMIEFENIYGNKRMIGEANIINECWNIIFKFLEERHFKSYYQRCHIYRGVMGIDVGSHTEFFYVRRQDGVDINWDEIHDGGIEDE